MWKGAYGLRNLVFWGRREGLVRRRHAFAYWAILTFRALCFAPDKRLVRARVYTQMVRDGWSGRLVNASPADWRRIAMHKGSVGEFLRTFAMSYPARAEDSIMRSEQSPVVARGAQIIRSST
jgi:hypothetical protein